MQLVMLELWPTSSALGGLASSLFLISVALHGLTYLFLSPSLWPQPGSCCGVTVYVVLLFSHKQGIFFSL